MLTGRRVPLRGHGMASGNRFCQGLKLPAYQGRGWACWYGSIYADFDDKMAWCDVMKVKTKTILLSSLFSSVFITILIVFFFSLLRDRFSPLFFFCTIFVCHHTSHTTQMSSLQCLYNRHDKTTVIENIPNRASHFVKCFSYFLIDGVTLHERSQYY